MTEKLQFFKCVFFFFFVKVKKCVFGQNLNLMTMNRGAGNSGKSKTINNGFKHLQTIIVYDIELFRSVLRVLEPDFINVAPNFHKFPKISQNFENLGSLGLPYIYTIFRSNTMPIMISAYICVFMSQILPFLRYHLHSFYISDFFFPDFFFFPLTHFILDPSPKTIL